MTLGDTQREGESVTDSRTDTQQETAWETVRLGLVRERDEALRALADKVSSELDLKVRLHDAEEGMRESDESWVASEDRVAQLVQQLREAEADRDCLVRERDEALRQWSNTEEERADAEADRDCLVRERDGLNDWADKLASKLSATQAEAAALEPILALIADLRREGREAREELRSRLRVPVPKLEHYSERIAELENVLKVLAPALESEARGQPPSHHGTAHRLEALAAMARWALER